MKGRGEKGREGKGQEGKKGNGGELLPLVWMLKWGKERVLLPLFGS